MRTADLGPKQRADQALSFRSARAGPLFAAIGFRFAVVVLLSGLYQAANIQAPAQAGDKPTVASSARPQAVSQPNILR